MSASRGAGGPCPGQEILPRSGFPGLGAPGGPGHHGVSFPGRKWPGPGPRGHGEPAVTTQRGRPRSDAPVAALLASYGPSTRARGKAPPSPRCSARRPSAKRARSSLAARRNPEPASRCGFDSLAVLRDKTRQLLRSGPAWPSTTSEPRCGPCGPTSTCHNLKGLGFTHHYVGQSTHSEYVYTGHRPVTG
jgi:hypothetical protein